LETGEFRGMLGAGPEIPPSDPWSKADTHGGARKLPTKALVSAVEVSGVALARAGTRNRE